MCINANLYTNNYTVSKSLNLLLNPPSVFSGLSHQGCRPILTKVCRVPNITAEAIREEAGPNLRRRAKGRKCHLEQLYRQNHGAAPAETRGAKNYRNLLASVGLARCSWTGGEADKQLRTVRAKCVRWNWKIGSKHHIPSLGRATGSHPIQGRVDTGQVVAAAATKLLESFQDDARGFRKQAAVDVSSYVGTQCHVECRSM